MKKPVPTTNPLIHKPRRNMFQKLDEEQKRNLHQYKWPLVAASTVLGFVVGGGWRLLDTADMQQHFHLMSGNLQQTNVWVNFFLTFGIAGALVGLILSIAGIDHFSHSKGNRR